MDEHELVGRVQRRGLPTAYDARRAIRATVAVLSERLDEGEARALASALPPVFESATRTTRHGEAFDTAELYDRVRRRESAQPGFARESVQVVARTLGELLPADVLVRITRRMPPSMCELFARPDVVEPPAHLPAQGTTLATGRPGSRHPLAESAPRTGAQMHSVVREANPHADRKLSSAGDVLEDRSAARPGAPVR